ncbi:MAG: hypothetical protein LAN18_06495 [Acidobacteriia bacterium]|nr:hypothetical protein [Terriglobia bacterium]
MNKDYVDIQVKGKPVRVPAAFINGSTVIAAGRWLKIANVMDEQLLDGETVPDPESFIAGLRDSDLRADIFTFAQKLPDITPKHRYHLEWDNAAAIPITRFSDWWERRAKPDVRAAVKRAKKLGVVVKLSEFNDAFVEGICRIYNESAVRQGKPFHHYRKDFETVKRENSTYLERSAFLGAYYNEELIGFIRFVYVGNTATTVQVIGQRAHFDKKPMNALIAKAVEVCEQKRLSHLVYGSYIYKGRNSSLTEFKRRNGFEQVLLPRYYIPLTLKGKIALKLNLHRPLADHVPQPLVVQLKRIQRLWSNFKLESETEASS